VIVIQATPFSISLESQVNHGTKTTMQSIFRFLSCNPSNEMPPHEDPTKCNMRSLLYAVEEGNCDRAREILLMPGVDKNWVDAECRTSLWHASWKGHVEIVKLLLQGLHPADVDKGDVHKCSPLIMACESGNTEVVQILLEAGASMTANINGESPLRIAVENDHEGIVEMLLKAGANVEQRDEIGITPLYLSAKNGCIGIVNSLLKRGAERNAANDCGETAVGVAASKGHWRVVKTLLRSGADANMASRLPFPLHIAAQQGHTAVVKVLLEHGADVDKTYKGRTSLWVAVRRGHLETVKVLLSAGCDQDIEDYKGSTPLVVACCSKCEVATLERIVKVVPFPCCLSSPFTLVLD
jgi:ankyrin repeat protein